MKYRKQILILLLIASFLTIISIALGNSDKIGLCSTSIEAYDTGCVELYGEVIAQPIFFFSVSIILVSLILLFTHESTYLAWLRFAKWAISIIFFFISLIIIIKKSLRSETPQ